MDDELDLKRKRDDHNSLSPRFDRMSQQIILFAPPSSLWQLLTRVAFLVWRWTSRRLEFLSLCSNDRDNSMTPLDRETESRIFSIEQFSDGTSGLVR